MSTCPTCNGTRESTQVLEGVGRLTAPCLDCGGKEERPAACAHDNLTPAFMPGSFYCNGCQAKIHLHGDGRREVKGQT